MRIKALRAARRRKGGNPELRKFTREQVIEMFELTLEGKTQREIVKIFAERGIKMAGSTVSAYLNGHAKVPKE